MKSYTILKYIILCLLFGMVACTNSNPRDSASEKSYQNQSNTAIAESAVPATADKETERKDIEQAIGGNTNAPSSTFMWKENNKKQPVKKDQSRAANPPNESYTAVTENTFKSVLAEPLSTFSIDVDAASYANMRRFINDGQLPPPDAVRVEELINYFDYNYPQPNDNQSFAVHTELGECPWNGQNYLVHIGLQGKNLNFEEAPANNLVFLLDVSGSMNAGDKLPLLKNAFSLLVEELRPQDRVAIVVYAGAAGLVLPSTSGKYKKRILNALNNLEAGGSTAGGAGLELAYKTATKYFKRGGNNRVILATDGDFNVGASSDQAMEQLITKKRESGIFLTTLGFGTGNLKDSKMETLADKGNGHYAYIDNLLEAKKVLVKEMTGTLFTIAKDVKIQVEFNPSVVQSYRLIGYENRLLNKEDFNDDTKDAGELGAGHTVTALYEVVPFGTPDETETGDVDPLKYKNAVTVNANGLEQEWMTVKLRYKNPKAKKSELLTHTITADMLGNTSNNYHFSAAVAGFGMLLRSSKHQCNVEYDQIIQLAKQGKGVDDNGYRAEFIRLVETAELLQKQLVMK